MVHGIRPDELVKLTPKLKPYLRRPNPAWPDIVDAADWLRHDLGVSKSLWGDACVAMGRELWAGRSSSREGLESAHPARCHSLRRGSLNRTYNGHSGPTAGTGLHAPEETLPERWGNGAGGWRAALRRSRSQRRGYAHSSHSSNSTNPPGRPTQSARSGPNGSFMARESGISTGADATPHQ
jgi:hypothetical protein